jgi:hypothetical protein
MDEMPQLSLQETYCPSILLYDSPGCVFTKRHMSQLNACWDDAYCKIFKYNLWELVNYFIHDAKRFGLPSLEIASTFLQFTRMFGSAITRKRDITKRSVKEDRFPIGTCHFQAPTQQNPLTNRSEILHS